MKRIVRLLIGVATAVIGICIFAASIYQITQGNWLWVIAAIGAGAIATAGVRVASGDRLRDVIEDLLFVLMRTN